MGSVGERTVKTETGHVSFGWMTRDIFRFFYDMNWAVSKSTEFGMCRAKHKNNLAMRLSEPIIMKWKPVLCIWRRVINPIYLEYSLIHY